MAIAVRVIAVSENMGFAGGWLLPLSYIRLMFEIIIIKKNYIRKIILWN